MNLSELVSQKETELSRALTSAVTEAVNALNAEHVIAKALEAKDKNRHGDRLTWIEERIADQLDWRIGIVIQNVMKEQAEEIDKAIRAKLGEVDIPELMAKKLADKLERL